VGRHGSWRKLERDVQVSVSIVSSQYCIIDPHAIIGFIGLLWLALDYPGTDCRHFVHLDPTPT
jgi:hypothetical protein